MYQPHPDRNSLFSGTPSSLVDATQNVQTIHFDDLQEMHRLVWELANVIVDWRPDLIPFFATGGIPYIFPVMHALERQSHHTFVDGQHFHLFPGLAWTTDSNTFYASSFGEVIRSRLSESPIRILVIDTTNSGNAVNNAVLACQLALTESGVATDCIELRVIGLVNTSHASSQQSLATKASITGADKVAHVLLPRGIRCPNSFVDRQFTPVGPAEDDAGFPLELSYWLAGNIPTEDRAELIGVQAIHETLQAKASTKSGRLIIVYGNGETQQGTGVGHLPGRLISLLSLPLDAWQWEKMQTINQLPPLSEVEMRELADVKELSDGGIRWIELSSMDQAEAVDGLLKINRPLMDVEVYWLGTVEPPPKAIASKVCASLEKGCCTSKEALRYFRHAFADLAASDPGGDAAPKWWIEHLRALPREAFTEEDELSISTSPEPDDAGLFQLQSSHGEDGTSDLALDFVVIVGGIVNARKLLAERQEEGMSLQAIEKYLADAWPITADKALRFQGPTNEQVTLNFVLESGGWEKAHDNLENWIARNADDAP